jgi:hypothetical protein
MGNNITADSVIQQLRALGKNKRVKAVVLRVDSGGGDALASDLMCMPLILMTYQFHYRDTPGVDVMASDLMYMLLLSIHKLSSLIYTLGEMRWHVTSRVCSCFL